MAYWLLQGNPAHWRIRDFFTDGHTSTVWTIRRFKDMIAPGDEVALWLSGKQGGVVAVGAVTGPPRFGTVGAEDEKYWTDAHDPERELWTVPVAFSRHFLDHPVPRATMKADERFAGGAIIRAPFAANPFPVEAEAWDAITERLPVVPEGSQMVAKTVLAGAAVAAAAATAVREALRSVLN